MISNPGDNRTALIAALIAIPAAALISMGVHTFVPVEQKPNVTVIASSSEAPQEGKMGFHTSASANPISPARNRAY